MGMNAEAVRKQLRVAMDEGGLNLINVASACDISDETVRRFLAGHSVHRLTLRAFSQFIESRKQVSPEVAKAATG